MNDMANAPLVAVTPYTEHAVTEDLKRPLHRELPPAAPFPMEALGALKSAAEAIHLITQTPLAICAQSVLATATLAIQAHHDVQGPIGKKPLTGLFVSIAESGERKSACDKLALRPAIAIEEKWRETAQTEAQGYKNAKEVWDEARSQARKKIKDKGQAMRVALDDLGPEPKPPAAPMLLVSDATPEGITLHLSQNRPWGGQFTAEGGLVIGGHGMKEETRMRAGAFYNTLWDGEPIRRTRAMAGNVFLPSCRFSMHLMMQPNVASQLLSDDLLVGLGTVARLLIVAPEPAAGTRFYRDPPCIAWDELRRYERALMTWLERSPPTEGDGAILNPTAVPLSIDAKRIWVAFHDDVEQRLGPNGSFAPIRAWGSKMPEHAMRLAATLAAYENPDLLEVSAEAMARGAILARHYAGEMLRLAGAATISPDLRLAQKLLAWWQARPSPRLSLADVYQRGLNAIRDAATARRLVAILEDHGWVRRLPPGTEIDGISRKEAWELRP